MLDDQPSRTVLRPAVLRAAHQLIDRPLILADPLAIGLVPEASTDAILSETNTLRTPRVSLLRAAFVLRSRFAEDCVVESAQAGIAQVVLLGAGLDTFPWRQPASTSGMRFFVTDHPASTEACRRARAERGLVDPVNVTHIGIDLEKRALMHSLKQGGFDLSRSAIFVMLGLAQYLSPHAMAHIVDSVMQCAAGSKLVMSFNPPDEQLMGDDLALAQEGHTRTKDFAEPWLFRPISAQLIELLQNAGMKEVRHFSPQEADRIYFAGRNDLLRAPVFEQLITGAR
ncbi:MAG: class I SAM-dependent methyltransferase [Hyphomicrobiaceae bacterium]